MAIVKEAERVAAGEEGRRRKRKKKTLRHQKIEIKPIRCPEARHVCFSELREGLVQEAIKFCARTGAQLAIVVFSPAGKPYSFGNPSVNAVIERCCDPSPAAETAAAAAAVPARKATTRQTVLGGFDSECERLRKAIAAEERRRDELDEAARAAGVWTSDDVVRGWGTPRLVAILAALERVQAEVAERAREMDAEEAMVPWYTKAMGASDGSFIADGSATSSQQGGRDTQTMVLLGGNVVSNAAHAPLPAFPPTTMPSPDLVPPPPQQQQQLAAAFQRLRL